MTDAVKAPSRARGWPTLRLTWALVSLFVVESVIFGVSALPAVVFWSWHFNWQIPYSWLRIVVLSMSFIPTYFVFACGLMILSALSMRLLGWRTPASAELEIAQLEWPLLNWARYSVATQLVRIFAGTFFRSTPIWAAYMRLNGARLGRRVFVNSLEIGDHCLLDFGDDVVIGAGVHLSGHTVERGLVKTAPVRLERGVMVGVNANVEIGVEAGPGCQIGAYAAVPKFAKLEAGETYVGIPARKLTRDQ